jgi:hypothetical protein
VTARQHRDINVTMGCKTVYPTEHDPPKADRSALEKLGWLWTASAMVGTATKVSADSDSTKLTEPGPRRGPDAGTSDRFRFEPRKVRIPLLPIEAQRAYGESFRRLWDFARTLRATHDEGVGLVRDLIDALATPLSDAQDHPVPSRAAPAP